MQPYLIIHSKYNSTDITVLVFPKLFYTLYNISLWLSYAAMQFATEYLISHLKKSLSWQPWHGLLK